MKHNPPPSVRTLTPAGRAPHRNMLPLLWLSAASFILSPPASRAADLATWDFSGLSGVSASAPATSADSAVEAASNITRGSGLTPESGASALSSYGWTTDGSLDPDDYYEFSVTPAPGSLIDIDTLHFSESRSWTGIGTFELRSSLDNFASTIDSAITVPDNESNRDHSISLGSAFDLVSGQVTFRIYGYAAEASGGTWRLRNHSVKSGLVLEGTPSTAAGALSINITPGSFPESSANPAAGGSVTRSGSLDNLLTVTLSSNDTTEATVPVTVEIPAGQSTVDFDVTAIDDLVPDGDVAVMISATAAGYTNGTTQITVQDDGDLPPLVINEVDCDTPGGDTAEFIELFNKAAEPFTMDGLVVVLFNGSTDTSYRTIDLSGHVIPANGFFVIGNTGVPNMTITLPIGKLRNGADAVALYIANSASIPDETSVGSVTGTLVDAVVYDTNDADDSELIAALTPGNPQVSEGTGATAEANSIARVPNGGAAFDTTLFAVQAPTPGSSNVVPPSQMLATWISGYDVGAETGFKGDYDNDGLDNAIENILGSNPSLSSKGMTSVSSTPNSVTFRHTLSATPASDLTAAYEWSTDMATWYPDGASDGGTTVSFSVPSVITAGPPDLVEVTATADDPVGKLFARLKVTNP